jgi:RimJ/RimL family protein N-acetyltransferase
LTRPTRDQLIHTKNLWEDEETMAFNAKWGGIVPFPETEWDAFYDVYCTEDPHHTYFHIRNLDGVVVGEVSSRYDDQLDAHRLNIKIHASARGNHHGRDALIAFLTVLFEDMEVPRVIDDVASDNEGAIHLLESVGFTLESARNDILFYRLERADWMGESS